MDEESQSGRKIWLALSGGGFRATLFQYGCMKRLNELGLLKHVFGMSATSGGAYAAALLATHVGIDDSGQDEIRYEWDSFEKELLSMAHRGLLRQVTVLVAAEFLYILAVLLSLFSDNSIAFAALLCGVLLHIGLAAFLIFHGAHKSLRDEHASPIEPDFTKSGSSTSRTARFLRMLWDPAYLRWQTLNLFVFRGKRLAQFPRWPRTYLTAVDMSNGGEVVFCRRMVGDLGAHASMLWKNSATLDQTNRVPIALAVAASSAFPPFFRPVTIHGGAGCFADGGVVDNLALNVPKVFCGRIAEKFKKEFRTVLVLDGSAPIAIHRRSAWGRIRTAFRLIDIATNFHFEDSLSIGHLLGSADLNPIGASLRGGFLTEGKTDPILEQNVILTRTNLDAFSWTECAALAYCGYAAIETAVNRNPDLLGVHPGHYTFPKSFAEILPEWCGPWPSDPMSINRHLAYSSLTFSASRRLCRALAAVPYYLLGRQGSAK